MFWIVVRYMLGIVVFVDNGYGSLLQEPCPWKKMKKYYFSVAFLACFLMSLVFLVC